MRQLTAYASYLDNLGAPLVGRARFYNADGEPSVVYHLDNGTGRYIQGGSVVFTNSSGQLDPQVFLADHDYIVVFDKYIGAGTMSEDDNPESWDEQGSAVDIYKTFDVQLEAGSVRSIDTVGGLVGTSPLTDNEVILCLGYNRKGDKEPIYYIWDADSTENGNGGSVIHVTGIDRGRWKFIDCPSRLDVRHFGAFPSGGIVIDPIQRYAIQAADDYSYANGCDLYFDATDEAVYYDITGLTIHNVDCNPNARVFAATGISNTYVRGIKNIYCASSLTAAGPVHLVNDVVKTSWEGESEHVALEPTRQLIMDSVMVHSGGLPSWHNIEVTIQVYNDCKLDGCFITCDKKITGPITIWNCDIRSSWFADDYDYVSDLNTEGNNIILNNFDDVNTYVTLKNLQDEADYGDLGEGTLTNAVLLANCIVENAHFDNVTLQGANELHNISGTVTVQGSQVLCNWIDCWLTLNNSVSASTFNLRRGAVAGASSATYIDATNAVFEDATINCMLFCRNDLRIVDCAINKMVNHMAVGSTLSQAILRSQFNSSVYLHGTVDNTVVVAQWIDNHSSVDDPLVIDRLKLNPTDSSHSYVYKGNTGKFIKSRPSAKPLTITFYLGQSQWVMNSAYSSSNACCYKANHPHSMYRANTSGVCFIMNQPEVRVNDTVLSESSYFDTENFFRIGSDPFFVRVNILAALTPKEAMGIGTSCYLQATLKGGYEWNMRPDTVNGGQWTRHVVQEIGHMVSTPLDFPSSFLTYCITGLPASEETDTTYEATYMVQYDAVNDNLA